jgi:hypothetical protein
MVLQVFPVIMSCNRDVVLSQKSRKRHYRRRQHYLRAAITPKQDPFPRRTRKHIPLGNFPSLRVTILLKPSLLQSLWSLPCKLLVPEP